MRRTVSPTNSMSTTSVVVDVSVTGTGYENRQSKKLRSSKTALAINATTLIVKCSGCRQTRRVGNVVGEVLLCNLPR